MITGSAPLGVEVQKYVQTVFECRVRQVHARPLHLVMHLHA